MNNRLIRILLITSNEEDEPWMNQLAASLQFNILLEKAGLENDFPELFRQKKYDIYFIDFASILKAKEPDEIFMVNIKRPVFLLIEEEINEIREKTLSSPLLECVVKSELNSILFKYLVNFSLKNSYSIGNFRDKETNLERTRNELERFFFVSLDMLCLIDFDGNFKLINPAFRRILGYDTEEIINKPFITRVHPEDIESSLNELKKLAEGVPTLYFENRFICKDQSLKWLVWLANPVISEKIIYAVAHDITSYKQMEEELRNYTTKLEQSNNELLNFANVASHDLQEPLRKVRAFGSRLALKYSNVLDETGLDYLDRMQKASERMQNLINDLLTFSRVTTKAQPFLPVNLEKVVSEIINDLEITIERNQARIEVGKLPVIDGDKLQLGQVFQNLISNAIKFSQKDKTPVINIYSELIDIREVSEDNKLTVKKLCRIYVRDNGIGFDEKYLDKIFTIFQRLHSRAEYEGTGIGLAICRKIAERHNGTITARSIPGEGSTFIITLPVKQVEE